MSANDCLFCKIAAGEVPAALVDQNDDYVAFRDINPQAPTHVLVIPRRHHPTLNEAADDPALLGGLLRFARDMAAKEGLTQRGYRVVINTQPEAGQTVFHLHAHVLGGRAMRWPPG